MGDPSALNHGAPGDTVVQPPEPLAITFRLRRVLPHIGSGSAQIGRPTKRAFFEGEAST